MTVLPVAILDLEPTTLVVLGVIAILLFGERLPEIARTFGKRFMDFKKGIQNIENEIKSAALSATTSLNSATSGITSSLESTTGRPAAQTSPEDHEEATAPKFEPPKEPG